LLFLKTARFCVFTSQTYDHYRPVCYHFLLNRGKNGLNGGTEAYFWKH
jgi:hypothetical protein